MSYCSLDGMPWVVQSTWYDALSGGRQLMMDAGARLPAEAFKLDCLEQHRLAVPGSNPSVCLHEGVLYVSVRQGAENLLGRVVMTGRAEVVGERALTGAYRSWALEGNPVRLFSTAAGLRAAACRQAENKTAGAPRAQVTLLHIDERHAVVTMRQDLHSARYEKNWMPCADPTGGAGGEERIRFVYSTSPLIVLDAPYRADELPMVQSILRGGSQLIAWEGGWLALVHQTHKLVGANAGKVVYLNRFARFDRKLTSVEVSDPFFFQALQVEVTGGIAYQKDRLLVGYGVNEAEAWIAEVSPSVVASVFRRSGTMHTASSAPFDEERASRTTIAPPPPGGGSGEGSSSSVARAAPTVPASPKGKAKKGVWNPISEAWDGREQDDD